MEVNGSKWEQRSKWKQIKVDGSKWKQMEVNGSK
jgi:hypothetical protein